MRYTVVAMFERGQPLGRTAVAGTRPLVGDLRVRDFEDPMRRRTVRMARLIDVADADENLLPPLESVELVSMSEASFTLSGVERLDGGTYFAQTWFVRHVPIGPPRDLEKMHPAARRRLGV